MRPIRRVALAASVLGLSLALAACAGKQEGGGRGPGGAPAVVTTTVLAPSPWRDSLEAIGTATARESVALTARVSETVADVRFDSGQQVRAGQVLVTLSQPTARRRPRTNASAPWPSGNSSPPASSTPNARHATPPRAGSTPPAPPPATASSARRSTACSACARSVPARWSRRAR